MNEYARMWHKFQRVRRGVALWGPQSQLLGRHLLCFKQRLQSKKAIAIWLMWNAGRQTSTFCSAPTVGDNCKWNIILIFYRHSGTQSLRISNCWHYECQLDFNSLNIRLYFLGLWQVFVLVFLVIYDGN